MPDPTRLPAVQVNKANTSVGTSFEDIGEAGGTTLNETPEINLGGDYGKLAIQLKNEHATNALADFQMLSKAHPNSAWHVSITGVEWATIAGILLDFNGALNTLAATLTATALIDVSGLHQVKFQADAVTAGSVTIRGLATQR